MSRLGEACPAQLVKHAILDCEFKPHAGCRAYFKKRKKDKKKKKKKKGEQAGRHVLQRVFKMGLTESIGCEPPRKGMKGWPCQSILGDENS